jgi:hypothetical protein
MIEVIDQTALPGDFTSPSKPNAPVVHAHPFPKEWDSAHKQKGMK